MTLNLSIPQQSHSDFTPRITVIGVGGGGTNAVDNMIHLQLQGVEFVVANTDAQQLSHSKADRRVQLGPHLTQGLGAGAKPEIGRAAAEEAADELARHLEGAHMVFITAGMGGGTGTGASARRASQSSAGGPAGTVSGDAASVIRHGPAGGPAPGSWPPNGLRSCGGRRRSARRSPPCCRPPRWHRAAGRRHR